MPGRVLYQDSNITVRLLDFDALHGVATIFVDEHVPQVGFYYITVQFASGNSHRIDYNGASPNCKVPYEVRTIQRNDTIQGVKAIKARD